jgi:toxin CcdB
VFRINGSEFMLETPKMAAVPARMLRGVVTSLAAEQAVITGALDFLFQGF